LLGLIPFRFKLLIGFVLNYKCDSPFIYVKENLIHKWNVPTAILYGSEDDLTEREVVEGFAKRFNCELTVLEGSEHWFHTEHQLNFLNKWLDKHI